MRERDPLDGLPPDLAAVLRDQSIIVPQDAAVFELIAGWKNAPSDTASAMTVDAWREAFIALAARLAAVETDRAEITELWKAETDRADGLRAELDEARQARDDARRERDEVYAVNAAAANDRANKAEERLQEIVALCEPNRVPLPKLNSMILRVARALPVAARPETDAR